MKKNDCNVIRDLMPLVLDRAASDESREMVETHISSCEECRKQYEEMKADMSEENRAEYEEEQQQFIAALKTIRAKRHKRKVGLLALVFAVALVAVLAAGFLSSRLIQNGTPVDLDKYSITLSKLDNGMIVVTQELRFNATGYGISGNKEAEDGKEIYYISCNVAPLRYISDGKTLGKSGYAFENISDLPDEIRQGTPEKYITVWKSGEEIPAASDEMEAYFETEAKVYPALYGYDTGASELDRIRETVPEWK